jgi:hypothetical protein
LHSRRLVASMVMEDDAIGGIILVIAQSVAAD